MEDGFKYTDVNEMYHEEYQMSHTTSMTIFQ